MNGSQATRLSYGLVLLVAPERLSKSLTGVPLDGRGRTVARALGARHLLQAIVYIRTGRDATQTGSVVDRMHAASMLVVAVFDSRRRRLALIDAAVAVLFSLAGSRLRVDAVVRPAPDRLVPAQTQGLPTRPAPTDDDSLVGDARRHRLEAARLQRAIRDAVEMGKGRPVERIRRDLVRALQARGAGPQPEPWLTAVASDAALGHVYVVNEQALTDSRTVLRKTIHRE